MVAHRWMRHLMLIRVIGRSLEVLLGSLLLLHQAALTSAHIRSQASSILRALSLLLSARVIWSFLITCSFLLSCKSFLFFRTLYILPILIFISYETFLLFLSLLCTWLLYTHLLLRLCLFQFESLRRWCTPINSNITVAIWIVTKSSLEGLAPIWMIWIPLDRTLS